ncbi:MAG: M20 family peptidase [Thermoanaerobaculia bacterium]
MRRILLAAGGGALLLAAVLAAVVLVRAAGLESRSPQVEPAADPELDLQAVERLAGALRIPTVSGLGEGEVRPAALQRFRTYLEAAYPRVHQSLERELVAGHSLLYRWPGSRRGADPLVLLAHQDVVPAGPGAAEEWTHPPFDGVVAEGHLWGRGALDDKGPLVAILEAVEGLLADGFLPERPVILAFGHDEEIGGSGAAAMAERLRRQGDVPFLVLDEGAAVVDGALLGVEVPVALVGVAEKGYLSLELRATGPGGHSSTPPPQTAVDVLVRALQRLRAEPLPAGIDGPVRQLLTTVAAEMSFDRRLVLANLWLFEPLVIRELAAQPGTDALIRTTTAPTMLDAGVKDNVLPSEARAVVNFRIHPRDTPEEVISHVRWALRDPRVEVAVYGDFAGGGDGEDGGAPPLAVPRAAPTDGAAYDLLARTVARVFPSAAVAPTLITGATDARHYTRLTDRVYRFAPFRLEPHDLERIHGTDERLALEDYGRMILFYRNLLRAGAGASGEAGRAGEEEAP